MGFARGNVLRYALMWGGGRSTWLIPVPEAFVVPLRECNRRRKYRAGAVVAGAGTGAGSRRGVLRSSAAHGAIHFSAVVAGLECLALVTELLADRDAEGQLGDSAVVEVDS